MQCMEQENTRLSVSNRLSSSCSNLKICDEVKTVVEIMNIE